MNDKFLDRLNEEFKHGDALTIWAPVLYACLHCGVLSIANFRDEHCPTCNVCGKVAAIRFPGEVVISKL